MTSGLVDNFDVIKSYLRFDNDDFFYIISIIKRKKDPGNEEQKDPQKVKDSFTISSLEDYERVKQRIIDCCKRYNARAYFYLNRRSHRQIALQTLKLIADYIACEQYSAVKHAYHTACGQHSKEESSTKKWIIDFDSKDEKVFNELCTKLEEYQKNKDRPETIFKYYGSIKTLNGYHFIVGPCDPRVFQQIFGDVPLNIKEDIHKNNPTLLYCDFS